jgi:hypothetical protein
VVDAVDAMVDGLPPTDVDVTTYVRCCAATPLTPQAGVVVVAIDPIGNVVDGISDAAGHVTLANVQPNSTVYAGYAESDQLTTVLVTVFGVNPGVHLVFGDRFGAWDAHGTDGSMTVNVPAYAGANEYRVSSSCFSIPSGSTMITVPLVARCQTPTTDLYAIAYDAQGGQPVATSYSPSATSTPGSVFATGPWIPSTPITASISGLTGVTGYVDIDLGSVATSGYDGTLGRATPVNGSATLSMLAPRSAPALMAYATAELPPNGMGKHEYAAKVATNATQATLVDPGIPWVGQSLSDGTVVTLSLTSGVYDAATVVSSWSRVDASSIHHTLMWSVIMPAGMTSFPWYPTLPAELAPFLVQPEDQQHGIYGSTTLVDFSDAATYDAALARPEWAFEVPSAAASVGDVEGGVAIAHGPQ